jgi:1,4-dihydroxy-2-naphthoate polyprenyltransferase
MPYAANVSVRLAVPLESALPETRFADGLWRLADPKISLASFSGLFLAASAAASVGDLPWGWLAVVGVGVFCVEVAKNASGEVVDFDSGADQAVESRDRSPFSGGKRVLVEGLLSRGQVWTVAKVGYLLAIAAGLAVALLAEPRVLWIGLAGLAGAWFYHARPLSLAYRGLGELAVALCYGPFLVSGTYLTLRHELSPAIVALGIPLGVAIAAFLWINELPDRSADRQAGKRTLVVRLGERRSARTFGGLVLAPYLLLPWLVVLGLPLGVLGGFVALPPAVVAAWRVRRGPLETRCLVPSQTLTLAAFLLLALGMGVGLLAT